jgi:hypothetical protein
MLKSSFRWLIKWAYGKDLVGNTYLLINLLELRIHAACRLLSSIGLFSYGSTLYALRFLH